MEKKISPGKRSGVIHVPASKSDGQRALLAAAMTYGKSVISGLGSSDDEKAILQAIKELGAGISELDGELIIEGIQQFPESATISAGESGLGIRLLGMICAAHKGTFTINGKGSLVSRPMHFFEEVLPQLGARCKTTNGFLPLHIDIPMKAGRIITDGSFSSQFISGLLMALPLLKGKSHLLVRNLKSAPYVEMTLDTLKAFGVRIEHEKLSDFVIPGNQKYQSTTYKVDADWSSASCWLVASALGHDITLKGLNMLSLQADKELLNFLLAANCKIIHSDNGLSIDGSNKQAFSVDATNCPDLFPALVTLASFCSGRSSIKGVTRLTHKESNRSLTLQAEFFKLGVMIELEDDDMIVYGTGTVNGALVDSHHDHRIAMCLAIAGLSSQKSNIIQNAGAVSKSYPEFWKVLEGLSFV